MVNQDNLNKSWQSSLVEQYVKPLDSRFSEIGPKHPLWKERIKEEILSLATYVKFLSSEYPIPWLNLKPDPNPKYNFMIWRGFIQVPSQPEIKFDMVILINSEYPKVIPRCFLEEKIADYVGKLYIKNIFTDPDTNKKYIMICHDHMGELKDAWAPNLTIAHFFIREVWYWFAAMQNNIIAEWNKKNH